MCPSGPIYPRNYCHYYYLYLCSRWGPGNGDDKGDGPCRGAGGVGAVCVCVEEAWECEVDRPYTGVKW